MKKLLATDLDGTLLKNDKTVSNYTINKVHEMINEGHYFVVATGRPFFRITKILKQLDIISDKIYCICNNGGLIISTDGTKVLYEENMPHEHAVELINLAIKYDVNMLVYQKDYINTDHLDECVTILNGEPRLRLIDGTKEDLKKIPNVCKIVYNGTHEKLLEFKSKVPSKILEKYNFVFSGLDFLEVNNKTIDKGVAINRLAQILDIDENNIYAVGDEENDLAMLKSCINGCCVSNANPKLKEISKYITLSNEEDGVAHLINKFILKPKVLVSACLLGDNCKYSGGNNLNSELVDFLKDYNIIKICPETFGGLPIPRVPSEIVNDRVQSKDGKDVTKEYNLGAAISLELAKKHHVNCAILKQRSPSCGVGKIYDGTFSGNVIDGYGVTATLLKNNNVDLYTEENYLEILKKKS